MAKDTLFFTGMDTTKETTKIACEPETQFISATLWQNTYIKR